MGDWRLSVPEIIARGVRYKAWNNELWNAGMLGNKLRSWNSYRELLGSGYRGTVSVRYLTDRAGGGGRYRYDVPVEDVPAVIEGWLAEGAQERDIFFNESGLDHLLLIQGELMRAEKGLHLFYATSRKKMRDALKEDGRWAAGLQASLLLQRYLDPLSHQDLLALLDLFPDHVIEFSTYGKEVGSLPHRNTVVWEVRDY